MVEINKNQYTCHSGYVGLPAMRFPVAPIAARILSSNAGERGPRVNAECGNYDLFLSLSSSVILVSYTLSREYRVVRNQYSRLLFTSEDCLCTNLHVREQSMNMTSQCQSPFFLWRNKSTVVRSQF